MGAEPRPNAETAVVRLGAAAASTVLLVVVIASLFLLAPGPPQTAILLVAVVLGLVLMLTRGRTIHRSGRPRDLLVRWHQFTFLWGATAGLMFLLSGRPAAEPRNLLWQQLVFAVVLVAVLWFVDVVASRRRARRERTVAADTARSDERVNWPGSRSTIR